MPIQQQRQPSFDRGSPTTNEVLEDLEELSVRDEASPEVDERPAVSSYMRKKRLSRTDSSIMIIRPDEKLEEKPILERFLTKPSPSPPILVENVHGAVKSLNSDRVSVFSSNCTVSSFGEGRSSLSNYSSCPNLMDKDGVSLDRSRIRSSKSSDGRLCKTAPSAGQSSRTSPSLLSVPNVFTTSFTHSKPIHKRLENVRAYRGQADLQRNVDGQQAPRKMSYSTGEEVCCKEMRVHRYSAPELSNNELQQMMKRKPLLTKSLSDTPHSAAIAECHSSEPRISDVGDFLCLGNLEAAHDERLLCRNTVASVLDLSNILPEDVPLKRKNIAPCTCGSATSHMRPVLRLTMCESDLVDVKSHFPRVNRFIDGACNNKKRVFVYCDSPKNNLSILMGAQYLMQRKKMNFRQAFSQIMKGRSDIELNPAYSALLQSVENELFKDELDYDDEEEILATEKPKPLVRKKSSSLLPKEAWTFEASD
ncbi:hypothetical protein CAPTEDRAFT_203101 [Capitella teleta]|uniref:protein-tyrosine-phosphatase n=1 Tax=Capitella teleta TaxID=283909 RepID=R7UXI2_CAPTE|nr:hypothetical protein CAPTEDRAFT_203101 [Capitella teleta]|eukprot:ELU11002.1 hypothetical protein CAPTEDRAFT_203101 [Capitella teleta]